MEVKNGRIELTEVEDIPAFASLFGLALLAQQISKD
ncbi:unnamed protein product, partial [marine sediment metagenome]